MLRWLQVSSFSKFKTFVGIVNLLAFLEIVCNEDLLFLYLFLFFVITCVGNLTAGIWQLVFTNLNFCSSFNKSFISPKFLVFFRNAILNQILYRQSIFFLLFVLWDIFFLYSYYLFHNFQKLLYNKHFSSLFWAYLAVLFSFAKASHRVLFGSKPKRGRIYKYWNIAWFCMPDCTSCIRAGCDQELVIFQSKYWPFLRHQS